MRVFAVRPDEDLRRRLDAHLEEAARPGGPTDNELLCRLLERGLATTDAPRDDTGAEAASRPSDTDGWPYTPATGTAPRGPAEGVSDSATETAQSTEAAAGDGVAALEPDATARPLSEHDGDVGDRATAVEQNDTDDAISDRVGDVVDTLYDR